MPTVRQYQNPLIQFGLCCANGREIWFAGPEGLCPVVKSFISRGWLLALWPTWTQLSLIPISPAFKSQNIKHILLSVVSFPLISWQENERKPKLDLTNWYLTNVESPPQHWIPGQKSCLWLILLSALLLASYSYFKFPVREGTTEILNQNGSFSGLRYYRHLICPFLSISYVLFNFQTLIYLIYIFLLVALHISTQYRP